MPIDRTSAEREVVNGEPQIVQEDGVLGWLTRGRPATVASTAMLCVASTALVAIAVTAPGYTATSIDLNDAGVWVTGTRQALLGQINTDTRQSAMAIPDLTANSFDVLQDGALVVETDSDASTIRKVDIPMRRFVTEPVKVPKVTLVAVGGGVLAAADPTTGKVWVQGPQDAGVQPVSTADPVVKVGKVAALAVGPDATIHLITADPARLTSIPAPAAQPGSPQVTDLHAIADRLRGASLSLTAVGERPVGLVTNRAGAAVLLPGGSLVDLPDGESARLQQPGDAADAVLVATASALYSVALDGGKVQRVSGGAAGRGAPAAPVWLGGCSYAAWSAYPPTLVTACQGQAARQTRIGAAPSQAPTLAFRVNRQRILLNDATTGETFMLDDSTHNVAVWDHMQKPAATHVENLRAKAVRRPTAADRNKPNHKPVVKPDIFGVRPGRTVVLPVLANDTDPDGDVLLASLAPGQSGNVARGAFDVVDGGKELQFHAGPRPGTVHVVYVADDGRANGQASATVTVRIVDPGEPHKPVPLDQAPEVAVRQGGTVSYDVLADWIDSEGDPLTLTCPKESDVRCRPDGVLTYRDGGGPVGSRSIPVQVGDGTGEPTEGILRIRVVAPDEEAPLARPDDARTFVGTPVVIRPLDNDTAFGLDPLRLGKVTSTDPAASVKVAGDSSVSFSTPSPGSVYLTYQVSAGPKTSEGLVRVDITQPTGEHAPVAAPDSVLVRPLEPAAVDVLANDSDPDGDVLVVTGAQLGTTLSASTAPRTEVIGHRLLRVTAPAGFTGTTTLTYTVSDGTSEAQGEVLVRSAPPEETDQPPIAADDEAVVRAGQIVTVPVLANDTDPEGLPLHLDPTIGDATFRQAGDSTVNKVNIFASGTTVRLFAPDKPGTVTATYTARDAAGQPDSAAVTVHVIAVDAHNNPPRPQPLEARTVAGHPVAITVPLSGTDPDGDIAALAPVTDQAANGTVTRDLTRQDVLVYTPRDGTSGPDQFTYTVVDSLGASATSLVRVGVARRGPDHPPVPVDDTVRVRNDRQRVVAVAVTANDTDADGDPITLASGADAVVPQNGAKARVAGNVIQTTTAAEARAKVLISYRITAAGVGGATPGLLTVVPDPDAPLLAPVPHDDVASGTAVRGVITVSPLANDVDPDGSPSDLTIPATAGPVGSVGPDGVLTRLDAKRLAATPAVTDRWGWYTVQDVDGQQSRAFVRIPGTAEPPHLRAGAPPVKITYGTPRTIPLGDVVVAPSGKPVRLTTLESISGSGVKAESADKGTALKLTAVAPFGGGAVTAEVMDGTSIEDRTARRAYVTIPVTIIGRDDRAPTLRPQTVTVARGEKQPQTIDLEVLTDDDPSDAGRHTYRLVSGGGSGVQATIQGPQLAVSGENAAVGTTMSLPIEVSDGRLKGQGTITVKVVDTLRPPPQATECQPLPGQRATAGSSLRVDLAGCTVNPFGRDAPLAVTQVTPQGAVDSATSSGLIVTISIPAGFSGEALFTYTVSDKLKRTASSLIRFQVADKPGQPGRPALANSSLQDSGQATIQWTAADPRGAPITQYVVRALGVDVPCPGDATQCTVKGLTDGTAYTFTLTAVNEKGEGPASAASDPITPDKRPEIPRGLTAKAQDGAVNVSWLAISHGSPITGYTITWQGGDGTSGTVTQTIPGATDGTIPAVVSGLTNGVGYTFGVVQRNASRVGDSDQATTTPPVYPRGRIGAIPAPDVTAGSGPAGGVLTVQWNPSDVQAAANGLITGMQIVMTGGQSRTVAVDDNAGSYTFDSLPVDAAYQFQLSVSNNWPDTQTGPAVERTAEGTPATATFDGAPAPGDGQAQVSFSNVVANGVAVKSITLRGGPSEVSVNPAGSGPYSLTVGSLNNGTDYSFTVEVCNNTYCSTSDPSPSVHPFGAPIVPAPNMSNNGRSVTVSWGAVNWNGAGAGSAGLMINGEGSSCNSGDAGAGGSCTFIGASNITYQATFGATNDQGQSGQATSNSVTTPPPEINVSRGASAVGQPIDATHTCDDPSCAWIVVELVGFAPNTHYTVQLDSGMGGFGSDGSQGFDTDGAGNAQGQTTAFFGDPNSWVSATTGGVTGTRNPWAG